MGFAIMGKTGNMPEAGHKSIELSGDGLVALLVGILKMGSFVNAPMKEGVCDPAGIGRAELKVMMALAGEGSMAGHDLTELMGVAPMNVSRAIASLRKRGWIEEAPDGANRRRKPVRLTAEGVQAYQTLAPSFSRVAQELLGVLTASERKAFARLSDRINESMSGWKSGQGE